MPTLLIQTPRRHRRVLPPRSSNWFWRNARKVVVAVTGFVLLLGGVAMLLLPGPGWLTIFAALGLLATEFAWARWVLKEAKRRFQQAVDVAKETMNGTSSPNHCPPEPQVDPQ